MTTTMAQRVMRALSVGAAISCATAALGGWSAGQQWTPLKRSIALWTMAAVYALSAIVQINDPDPWAWLAVYVAAMLVALAALRDLPTTAPAALVGGVALVWAGTLLPKVVGSSLPALFESWEMMSSEVEEGRELGGLVLVIVGMGLIALRGTATTNERRP